ncbi:hypothetical protein J7E97_08000 [Streptomyces sp. ISL-66]|uniref:hypothetical protein n=1 Tax=Streptomyces sp. ISL-66 TaxID=2819186 RepID=UPI001BEBAED7|nr:hypothetical protein [Streptomyces sp. ISL-66]MBT2467815.1 hypothetical protein [Streptomyces sp. ISL-66]
MSTCCVCHCPLRADEADRYCCHPCQRRIDDNLAALPGLYAELTAGLAPGAGGNGPRVSGSRSAPVPVRLEALSLIADGGVVSTVEAWVVDWADRGYATPSSGGRLAHRLDHAVGTLRFNLDAATRQHPAIEEFAKEIGHVRRVCTAHAGLQPSAQLTAICPCGGTLRFSFDAAEAGCRDCGDRYEHCRLIELARQTGGIAA